eukprot:TRINITY_DN36321_c0_g1_i1.p1 TRINITY_DN36321_c0_g1~~TRINITY_DN36321_c0_g1_i1.p1  ORF type:complete len:1561 (+),score=282.18 TRINITY_DN36321_c0_g1_i1:78-4685(+)
MAEANKEAMDSSFDSKEDYELYMRLMNERQRIQHKTEEKKRQTKALKLRQKQAQTLEERERGFQLHFAGANAERLEDEARRRQQQADRRSVGSSGGSLARAASRERPRSGKEWQVETVELRGKDGEVYRCSPHSNAVLNPIEAPVSEAEEEIGEDLAGFDGPDEGSRPSTGGSVSGLDQDTRGVLRMMTAANQDQLSFLRESLSSQIDRRVPSAGSGLPPQPQRLSQPGRNGSVRTLELPHAGGSRPSSGNSRPSSASSVIASAIQAENARVKKLSEASNADMSEASGEAAAFSTRPGSGDFTLGSSRPSSRSSRTRQRLPLGPEEAAGCAPPSVLGSAISSSRLVSGGGYPSPAVSSFPAPAAPASASSGERQRLPESQQLRVPEARSTPPRRDPCEEIVDRVGRLDQRKQKALLRVLASLESSEVDSPERLPPTAASSSSSPAPRSPELLKGPPAEALGGRGIRLRVLSNWGDPRQCGLSLLEALDTSAEVIRIPPAALSLQNAQGGSTTIGRVLEGSGTSTNEKHMWVGTPSQKAGPGFEPFELVLSLPQSLASVAALRIWNFNSPDTSLSKGAREVEVWCQNSRIWSGELPMGTGSAALLPVVAPLEPGFSVAYAMPSSTAEDLRVAAPSSPERPAETDRPIWLDGNVISTRTDFDNDDGSEDDTFEKSPARGRSFPGPREEQQELMQSLQALELFRASQSRRFFNGLRGESQEDRGASSEGPHAPAPSPLPDLVDGEVDNFQTAQFGSPALAREQDLLAEAAAMGLEIPVRNFDDNDALDGLVPEEHPPDAMGTSLVASQFNPMESVVIPTLPSGRSLVFNCVSTWGDKDFVGLAGIEIFDGRGFPVVMKDVKRQVTADPHSINVLSEYEHDPRTPDKLFDQVNLTRDDLHVWLAPFSPGRAHTITVDLERKTEICMIRVWNYNKSRLHSSRGVRQLEILLDDHPIFIGEVRRAPGVLTEPEEACEHILFTQDEDVLEAVAEHDWLPAHLPVDSEDEDEGVDELEQAVASNSLGARPPTADLKAGRIPSSPRGEATPRAGLGIDGRPMTRANVERQRARGSVCSSVTIVIHSTWGDQFYVGLTALELLDGSLSTIPLQEAMIDAYPRDLNDLEGVSGDVRTLDKLLDGVACTTDDSHMWLAPFLKVGAAGKGALAQDEAPRNMLRIDFGGQKHEVAGFNMWNYNKNVEDTCRGIREFSVYCDERFIATFLCRKAPGHVHFDFKQVVLLDQPPCADSNVRRVGVPPVAPSMPSRGGSRRTGTSEQRPSSRSGRPPSGSDRRQPSRERGGSRPSSASREVERPPSASREVPKPTQQYETPLHPSGFIFKLQLVSTWSDVHYVGLDGVELYDLAGRPLRPRRAHSNHGSVRNMPGMEADVRTEETFLKGAPGNSSRMWLAPFSRQSPNFVELIFDEPTQISCVKFWNYSRTPARGVRDVEIYVDDILIYQGILRQVTGERGSVSSSPAGEAVLFTSQAEIVERERSLIYLPSPEELVAFFDESGRWDQRTGKYAPGTSPLDRPTTAVIASQPY